MIVQKRITSNLAKFIVIASVPVLITACSTFGLNGNSSKSRSSARYASANYDPNNPATHQSRRNHGGHRPGGGDSLHQPKEDASKYNTQVPERPITDHLPGYGQGKKTTNSSDRKPVLKSLQRKDEAPTSQGGSAKKSTNSSSPME